LGETESLDKKMEAAKSLLREVAVVAECPDTWKTLVEDRLVAAEQAMRYLLPTTHRDHVLHSAHLYLLGLALYLKMLRPDPVLAAVIADNYYRDAQAFFSSPDTPYSCHAGLLSPKQSLAELRTQFPNGLGLPGKNMPQLLSPAPSDIADSIADQLSGNFQPYEQFCGPGRQFLQAVEGLTDAIGMLDETPRCASDHLPRSLEDIDAMFRRGWGMTSVLHDSAYPIELAAKQIDDYVQKTIAPLGSTFSPCPNPFGLTLNCICDFVAVPLVQNVCSDRLNPLMYGDNSLFLLATNLSHKLHVEYSPQTLAHMMMNWLESRLANGQVDHGMFSALLMLRQINHELRSVLGGRSRETALAYDNNARRITSDYSASAVEFFYLECVDAAAAVYLHNTKLFIDLFKSRPLDYRNHPFAWLLLLCDQLQEWLRPSGGVQDGSIGSLFDHAKEYEVLVDSAGPKLYFKYPSDAGDIGAKIQQHLVLFGEDFIRQAK
jgi:hypothetical protein